MNGRFVLIFIFAGLFTCMGPGNLIGPSGLAAQEDLLTAVERVAEKIGPTVVSIQTEMYARVSVYGDDELDGFDRFFEDFFGVPRQYAERRSGLGSGVIIDARGYILTNAHVVREADVIEVMLPDGRRFNGELKGIDARSDLAVIKISAPELPVVSLGNSDDLKIGQWVVAIGNPFGHVLNDPVPTVTSGVISALHRALPRTSRREMDYSDLIQTDAAINPGNSGGPLVNTQGEVVGINVAIFSTSGGYQGIGFAIPVNYAKALVEQVTTGKAFEPGWIGVGIQDIDSRLAQYFRLPANEGVLVLKVMDGSPAQKAGFKEGDIVLTLNGIKMPQSTALVKYVANAAPGKELKAKILRDGKDMDLVVTVEKRPSKKTLPTSATSKIARALPAKEWRGLTVEGGTEKTIDLAGPTNPDGVFVAKVAANSPAQKAGIKEGDVIVAINKNMVRSLTDYNQVVRNVSGSCLVRTRRGYFVLEE